MNQILISEKVYVTPELKKKRRMYKIDFFISVCLVFILSSYYIYAEYDKNKNEEKSHEILSSLNFDSNLNDDTTIKFEDNATLVILNEMDDAKVMISTTFEDDDIMGDTMEDVDGNVITEEDIIQQNIRNNTHVTESGQKYYVIAKINIPSISCEYPILSRLESELTWSDELLKIAPCYYHGAQPNKEGNFCVVGHNYRTDKFFSNVPDLELGADIELKDITNKTVKYKVYDKYIVDPLDTSCTSQLTDGKTELTIITCTDNGEDRVIVKARMVEE